MKVLRNMKIKTSVKDMQIGDQITVPLKGFGVFTATVQKKDKNGVLFLFDECVAERPMNENGGNEGGFAKSDLCQWLETSLLAAFPDYLREKVDKITLPTYGQIFGHDDFYRQYVEEDCDGRFPLMKSRKKRIADYNNDWGWYWLKNAIKDSSACFAIVASVGVTDFLDASYSLGVRPAFLLKY